MLAARSSPLSVLIGASLAAAACGRAPAPASPAASGPAAPDAGFLAPPTPVSAERSVQGEVRLSGRAPPHAAVRLVSPTGDAIQAGAGADGGWTAAFAPAPTPRLYALSAQAGRRTLRGEGALAVLPAGSATPALLLRSGAAAWPAQAAEGGRQAPRLASVDFDAGGGFAASGWAKPGAVVRLMLDGAVAGQGQADAGGRFAVLAVAAPATASVHAVDVRTDGGIDARVVVFAPPAPLAAPFRAARTTGGWRIDWAAPGGGVQSVVAFDDPAAPGLPPGVGAGA